MPARGAELSLEQGTIDRDCGHGSRGALGAGVLLVCGTPCQPLRFWCCPQGGGLTLDEAEFPIIQWDHGSDLQYIKQFLCIKKKIQYVEFCLLYTIQPSPQSG